MREGKSEFPMFNALRLLTSNTIQLLSLLRVLDSSLPSIFICVALNNYIIRNYGSCYITSLVLDLIKEMQILYLKKKIR